MNKKETEFREKLRETERQHMQDIFDARATKIYGKGFQVPIEWVDLLDELHDNIDKSIVAFAEALQ